MKTFLQFIEAYHKPVDSYSDIALNISQGDLIQRGIENPHKLPFLHSTKTIKDEKWAIIFRKRYHVAQRKFSANNPGYQIKRGIKMSQTQDGIATWCGHVFYKDNLESIGSFSFSVYHRTEYPKPVAEIEWIGLYALERDYKGDRIADWNRTVVEHRGIMTQICILFMEQVHKDISCVVLDDGSGGYWKHFFKRYYPELSVFDI